MSFRKGTAKKAASKSSSTGTSSSAGKVDTAALESMYNSLIDPDDPDEISMEGIATLAEQLEIDPSSDVRLLVLLWKMGAKAKPGVITKQEFMNGCENNLHISSASELKALLPSFDPGFLFEKSQFREFYRFVFQFSREGTNKTIERDVVAALLPMVLDVNRAPHLTRFLEFLTTGPASTAHPRITLDQWDSFLQFNYSVDLDLANHDDDGAWPLLLDEYVEWRRATDLAQGK